MPPFLFLFLPVVLTGYFLLSGLRARNLWLLGASLFFYAWGEPAFILLLLMSTLLNFLLGKWIESVVDAMQEFPGLPPLRLSDFTWTNLPPKGGELISDEEEHNYFEFYPIGNMPGLDNSNTNDVAPMWDIHRKTFVVYNGSGPTNNALIFHDSFGLAWRHFLGCEFKQTFFLSDNREFNSKMLLRYKPDIAINEMVERFFADYDPEELMEKDAL